MRILKRLFFLCLSLHLTAIQTVWSGEPGTIQFVESIPVETNLGISETEETLGIWLEMISGAQESIDMEFFYVAHEPGKALDSIMLALREAAARNVNIRILVDDKMAKIYPDILKELGDVENIGVSQIRYFNLKNGVQHAKYFIVDNRELFIGSQNLDWRAIRHIHELGTRIIHPGMAKLMKTLFELDWFLATAGKDTVRQLPEMKTELLINRQSPARLLYNSNDTLIIFPTFSPPRLTFPGLENDEDHIVRLMNQAIDRLEIQLLSYKPVYYRNFYRKIDNAIRAAAARGVKVRMVVSNWNTGKWDLPYVKSLQVIPGIEIKISNIPQWSGGFIPYARVEHCKYMVVDEDDLWLGTSNWSRSYFQQSRNLGLVIRGKAANDLVHRVFSKSWLSEYCQTLEVCAEYSPPRIKPLD